MRRLSILFLFLSMIRSPGWLYGRETRKPLTVADSIEAISVLYDSRDAPALVSPNGKRYLVVLQRGDVARNGSWVELLSGSTASVVAASRGRVAARFFSSSTARAGELIRDVRWLGDGEHVTFLWDDGVRLTRIVSVNTQTHRVRTLVRHSTPIVRYDISRDGQTIVFIARSPVNMARQSIFEQDGFPVTHQSIWSILRGNFDGWTSWGHYETFVVSRPGRMPRRVRETDSIWSTPPELLRLAPNARQAVLVRPAADIPQSWNAYTEHLFKDVYLPPARENPADPNFIRQYFVVDIKDAMARPLWDAPENPLGDLLWSPDSRALVIGPTFVPPLQASPEGLSGTAIAEVNVASRQLHCLPIPGGPIGSYSRPVRWGEDGVIDVAGLATQRQEGRKLSFKMLDGEWKQISKEEPPEGHPQGVRIEVREDPNTPPALYAVDDTNGEQRLIRDLNPQLRTSVALGHVDLVHWKATDEKSWTGMLYYPVHYEPGRSFPFVIQTHGYSAGRFSLDGPFMTAFAAQELANRDIAVLQVGSPDSGTEGVVATPEEPKVHMAGFEGAIKHFVDVGLADRVKVGIIGFSRTGWFVEYMLTHSEISVAAAEVADNIDGSYFQYVLDPVDRRVFDEEGNGARPFGKGIEIWARTAPGFNADRVDAPLRMEVDTGTIDQVLGAWEMFSNLRYLRKPVELFVIPDIQHGVHVLQNPKQRLASQGGTVDWFCFWLKAEEDPDPSKAEQYSRWRELRKLQEQNEQKAAGGSVPASH